MSDLKNRLTRVSASGPSPKAPDWDRVMRRGKRLKLVRGGSVALATLMLALGGWVVGVSLTDSRPSSTELAQEAPSSHSLAYAASGRGGELDIFVARPDGSDPINLTNDSVNNASPVWSPDGTQIAFIQQDASGTETSVYVMRSDGSEAHSLVDGPGSELQPAWSPDGDVIAYVSASDGSPDIRVINSDGSNDQLLIDREGVTEYPEWSPDGTQIAFASDNGTNREIFVMNADGSGVRALTEDSANDRLPSWSPNGEQIVFVRTVSDSDAELFVMNADGTQVENLWTASDGQKGTLISDTEWTSGGDILFSAASGASGYTLQTIGNGERHEETLELEQPTVFGVDTRQQ
jgi:Tol biopolymer transport system component